MLKMHRKLSGFDFSIKYKLAEAVVQKKYSVLQANPSLAAIAGYGEKSITFLDNHDTGCINRNDCDNVFSKNTSELIQGYAYLLTHPGIPMVREFRCTMPVSKVGLGAKELPLNLTQAQRMAK